jgi:cytochrome P450
VTTAPGPSGLDALRTLLQLRRDPLPTLECVQRRFGSVVRFPLGSRTFYLVGDPAGVQHVLQDNARNYNKDTSTYAKVRSVLGNGLLTSDGPHWKRQRRVCKPAFCRGRLAATTQLITRRTTQMLSQWRADQELDVRDEMMRLTLSVVSAALLGADLQSEADAIGEALTSAMQHVQARIETVSDWPQWLPTPSRRRFREARGILDAVAYRLIDRRRQSATRGDDVLSLLLEARDPQTGKPLSDEAIRDEVVTLMLAGHETTASALTWVWVLLSAHPHVERRVHQEVAQVLGSRVPSHDDLSALPLVRRVVQEALRLYPPLWMIERRAIGADEIAGHSIEPGSIVAICSYLLHRDERFWSEPQRFDPDRFLPERAETRPRYAYLPFGGGPRRCVGAGLAMMEAQLIVAMVVRSWRVCRVDNNAVDPVPLLSMRPPDVVRMRLEPRDAEQRQPRNPEAIPNRCPRKLANAS